MFSYIRYLLLPHPANNFRAKLLQLDFFTLYVAAFFILSLTFRTVHRIDPDILGFATDIHVSELLNITNQKRAAAGNVPLKLDARLSEAAAKKASHMFSQNYWAHTAPDGTTPWSFINRAGYAYTVAGENLAKNFSNSEGVVEAWMNSVTHRENLLRNEYQDIGFAVVNGVLNGEETTLVVQMFGKRLTQLSQVKNENGSIPQTAGLVAPQVRARENEATQVARFISEVASPSPIALLATSPSPQSLVITAAASSVVRKPMFDMGKLFKQLTLGLSTVLIVLLVVDALYIWHRRIARIGGRTFAHILLLFILSGIIWFMSFGSIL